MDYAVSNIRYNKINRQGSNVGFVSFVLNNVLAFKNVAVHQLADKSGYRLVYEDKDGRGSVHPISKILQEGVEEEIFCYLKAQDLLT